MSANRRLFSNILLMIMLAATTALAIRRHLFRWTKARHIQWSRVRTGHAEFPRPGRERGHDPSYRRSTLSACRQRCFADMLKIFFFAGTDRLSLTGIGDIFVNGHDGLPSHTDNYCVPVAPATPG
jgi:hypothetical protein